MDRARRTATTARRKTISPPAESLSDHPDHPAAASPLMAHAFVANSPQPGTQTRRGSKSLQQDVSSSMSASATRGQAVKGRSRTMDAYGHPDDSFDQDSPRKGGHTLRKRARVDYTFEHVDDEVVVPNSTSSRAKKRKPDHSHDSEDVYASGAKKWAPSVGADTVAGPRRSAAGKSMTGGAEPGDDEDVQDTIEVSVSYSDMEDCEIPSRSNASASSARHSFDGSWKSAPVASHFAALYSSKETVVADRANVLDDGNQEENIDPQLRASLPASPKATVDIAEPVEEALPANAEIQSAQHGRQGSPSTVQSVPAIVVPSLTTQSAAVQDVSADAGAADASIGRILSTEVATDEQGSPVSESSVSDEIRQQLIEAEAHVPEPSPTTKTEESAVSPEGAAKPSLQPDADRDGTDASGTTPSSPMNVAEEPAKSKGLVEGTPEGVEMAHAKQSPSRQLQATTPSISIGQAVESEVADTRKGQGGKISKDEDEDEEVEAQDAAMQGSKTSPNSSASNEKDKVSDVQDVVPVKKRDFSTNRRPSHLGPSKPQPTPAGRWSYLTPYVDGEYVSYPEKKARSDDDAGLDETTPEDKDADKEADKDGNDMEPMVEDNDDGPDPAGTEAQTPALNSPLRGSPVPDSMDPTASNSPAPAGEDADEADVSESQEPPERRRFYKYRKLRDADEYITAVENYEDMSTAELYEVIGAINVSLVQWQSEWTDLGKVVDDYENALRRRVADAKYEARTRNLTQHGVNHEEPDFAVKGYKAKERELMSETRYLQGQDRVMSATYGFEYDPHPSKIGRQNPETQQVGIMTRGRSLRNQPKQTVKASEADEVTGKRQRKPIQLFDPATQDVSRSSTPVPTRGRRRRNVNADDDAHTNFASSFNPGDEHSDAESVAPKGRRQRGPRSSNAAQNAVEELAAPRNSGAAENEEIGRSGRRRAARQTARYEDMFPNFLDDHSQPASKKSQLPQQPPQHQQRQQRRRHLLTLKIPRSKNLSEPSSGITDNGDSRPSSASSDSTSHTAESSYSFRPKRQKRFRHEPDETEEATQAPPRKRVKRSVPHALGGVESSFVLDQHVQDAPQTVRKVHKIKVVRPAQDARNETPSSTAVADGNEKPKDYKSMTKSEKMSASMKSRWANGNMAGAVEKRKATLAAKKAAQVAADSKIGAIAPKPKVKPHKKEVPPEGHAPASYFPMPGLVCPYPANQ